MGPACGTAGKLHCLPPRNQRWIFCPIMQEINLFYLGCYVFWKKSQKCNTDQIKQLTYSDNFGVHVNGTNIQLPSGPLLWASDNPTFGFESYFLFASSLANQSGIKICG